MPSVPDDIPLSQLRRAVKKHQAQYVRDTAVTPEPEIHETHELADFAGDAGPKKRSALKVLQGRDAAETLRNIETKLQGNRAAQRNALSELFQHPEAAKLTPDLVKKLAPRAYTAWEWGVLDNASKMGGDKGDMGRLARNAQASLKKGNLAAANAFSAAAFTASKGQSFERMEEVGHSYFRGERVEPTTPENVRRVIDADDVEVQTGKSAGDRVPEWKWDQAARKADKGDEFNPPKGRGPEDVIREEERSRAAREENAAARGGQRETERLQPKKSLTYEPDQTLLARTRGGVTGRRITEELKRDLPLFFSKGVRLKDLDVHPEGRSLSPEIREVMGKGLARLQGGGGRGPQAVAKGRPLMGGDPAGFERSELLKIVEKGLKNPGEDLPMLEILRKFATKGVAGPAQAKALPPRARALLKLLRLI